jgi:hypothetical protein
MRLVPGIDSTASINYCKVLRGYLRVLGRVLSSLNVWAVARLSLCMIGLFSAHSPRLPKVMGRGLLSTPSLKQHILGVLLRRRCSGSSFGSCAGVGAKSHMTLLSLYPVLFTSLTHAKCNLLHNLRDRAAHGKECLHHVQQIDGPGIQG